MARKRKRTFKKTSIPGVTQVTNVDGTVKYKCQRRFGNGKRESKVFDSIIEAKKWFPDDEKKEQEILKHKSHTIVNGSYTDMTLGDLIKDWKDAKYPNKHLSAPQKVKGKIPMIPKITNRLSLSTALQVEKRLNNLFDDDSILSAPLHEIDRERILNYFKDKIPSRKRKNWRMELDDLRTIFNWYIERNKRNNQLFLNPIDKTLREDLSIPRVESKKKQNLHLSEEDVDKIFEVLDDDNICHKLVELQLILGTRVGEVLALRWTDIDFKKERIVIKYTTLFDRNVRFLGLQDLKDKGLNQMVKDFIPRTKEILLDIKEKSESMFVFGANKEEPITRRKVAYHYNKLLKSVGIDPSDYQGITHLMRHTSCQVGFNNVKNIEKVQAHSGHRNRNMVEKYAPKHLDGAATEVMTAFSDRFSKKSKENE